MPRPRLVSAGESGPEARLPAIVARLQEAMTLADDPAAPKDLALLAYLIDMALVEAREREAERRKLR